MKKYHPSNTRLHIWLITIALLIVMSFSKEVSVQAQEATGCTFSDLSIEAIIPKGYTRIPSDCPKVSYRIILNPNHALGFYIIETPYPYHSSDKQSLSETINDQISLTQNRFDMEYMGQSYNSTQFDDKKDYPPSILDHGGVCGGLEVKLPFSYQRRKGVEWRRGIICLVELPPSGSGKWTLIQAFFFDMNLESIDYKPSEGFRVDARRLFRSIQIKKR